MNYENPIRLIRELKGAPLSVILALGVADQPVSMDWIAGSTGYSHKPVSQALAYLQEIDLVERTRSGWVLKRGAASQLPLAPILEPEDGKFPTTTTTTDIHTEDTVVVEEVQNSIPDPEEQRRLQDRLAALVDCGIGEPARSRIAHHRTDLTGPVIRAWHRQLKKTRPYYTTGLLVTVLLSDTPPVSVRRESGDTSGYREWGN